MRKYLILFIVMSLPLAACGVKPESVDAPASVEKDAFPQQYPSKD